MRSHPWNPSTIRRTLLFPTSFTQRFQADSQRTLIGEQSVELFSCMPLGLGGGFSIPHPFTVPAIESLFVPRPCKNLCTSGLGVEDTKLNLERLALRTLQLQLQIIFGARREEELLRSVEVCF